MIWKYTDSTNTVVYRINEDGSCESHLVEVIADWLAEGNTPEPADPPPPLTKDELDIIAAKTHAKLVALKNMTPAQVQAWCDANITNLAQARDALTTLAIAVSILARRL
jgi:hypothetical protein